MIRDITIGQYYPADSVIHKLDPRTKLVGTHWIYCICIFVPHLRWICSGYYISCRNDPFVQGSCEVYF